MSKFGNKRMPLKQFTDEQAREIVFKTMLDSSVHHTVTLDGSGLADYRSVAGFFAHQLLREMRMVGGYELLYPKIRDFMRDGLFEGGPVNLESPVVLRNFSEPDVVKVIYDTFKSAINALTILDSGTSRIEGYIRLKEVRPFRTEYRAHVVSRKSVFNLVVGEPNAGGFELEFAAFLEAAPDVQSFTKNYMAVGFKLDYVKADGDLAMYLPDFILRTTDGKIWFVETKGREELDLPQKMERLRQYCMDASSIEAGDSIPGANPMAAYDFVYVDQASFEKYRPKSFAALVSSFLEFKS